MTPKAFNKIMQFIKSKFTKVEEKCTLNTLTLGIQSKNLLKLTIESVTMNGVRFDVKDDNSISLSGTLSSNGAKTLGYITLKKGVSYRLSGVPKGIDQAVKLAFFDVYKSAYISGVEDTGDGVVYTPDRDIYVGIRLPLYTPFSTAGIIVYPMLCYADITCDSYEPYKSSNLQDYIENTNSELALIKSTIGTTTKNLLDVNMTTTDWDELNFKISDGIVTVSGRNTTSGALAPSVGKIKLNAGDKIRLSGCPDGGGASAYGLELRSIDKTRNYGGCYNNTTLIINITETAEYYVVISIASNYSISGQLEFKPMIQHADIIDKTYEPYTPDLQNQVNEVRQQSAVNISSIGLQRKNLLKNKCRGANAVGLTLTVNDDGIININGVHTNNVASVVYWNMANGSRNQEDQFIDSERHIPPGTYILSGGAENAAIQVCVATEEQFQAKYNTPKYSVYQGETTVTITEQDKYVWFRIRVREGNINFNNVKLYPMLRPVSITDPTYEPYVDDIQTQIDHVNGQCMLTESCVGLHRRNLLKNSGSSQTINGVTFTVDPNGSVHAKGTATDNAVFYVKSSTIKLNIPFDKKCILNGCPKGGSDSTYFMRLWADSVYYYCTDTGDGAKVDYSRFSYNGNLNNIAIFVMKDTKIDDTFYPMLRYDGITDDTYEPYVDDLQTQINMRPILKTLDITGDTSANGNITLTDGNIKLTRNNAIILSVLALTNTGNVATACSLGQSYQDYFVHCFSADKNHTVSASQTMRVIVHYYDIT